MREAFGGVFSLEILLAFVLLVNGYMAYSVNYTRAFRVKNKIIDIIEESEGYTTGAGKNTAESKISAYIDQVGYGVNGARKQSLRGQEGCSDEGYCVTCIKNTEINPSDDAYRGTSFRVETWVNIDIPVLNKFLPLGDWLRITGDTRTIYDAVCED